MYPTSALFIIYVSEVFDFRLVKMPSTLNKLFFLSNNAFDLELYDAASKSY